MANKINKCQNTPQARVMKDCIFQTSNIEKLNQMFHENKPFPLAKIENFLDNDFLLKLESSLTEQDIVSFDKKDNDLYRFYQSYGLQETSETSSIQHLIGALYSDKFRQFLYDITGKRIDSKPDLFASCYTDTSYLLCHDDQIEDRSIAFILYLVPPDWNDNDGGCLNIYDSFQIQNNDDSSNDNNNNNSNNKDISSFICPQNEPFKQILPLRNSVVFFEVSDKSFHAVDEVLSQNKSRIAIGGWWHDSNKKNEFKPPMSDPKVIWNETVYSDCNLIKKWLNPIYLKPESMKALNDKFVEESHVTLLNLLNDELYYKLLHQLFALKCAKNKCDSKQKEETQTSSLMWKLKGPIHRQLYHNLDISYDTDKGNDDIDLITEFKQLMESREWKQFIAQITSLDLLKNNIRTRKFDHKHYTIAHDLDRFKDIPGLDVNFQIIENEENGWDPSFGGSMYYTVSDAANATNENELNEVDSESDDNDNNDQKEEDNDETKDDDNNDDGEDEESELDDDDNILISIHCIPNSLSVTYRSDSGVMSFVKYINHNAPCSKIDFMQVWTVDTDSKDDQNQNNNENKKRKICESADSSDVCEPPVKRQKT